MHIDHPRASVCRRGDSLSHLVRNVVELEIEKYPCATRNELPDESWSFEREQPAADFDPADDSCQPVSELERAAARVHIEGD
jgi:hypothetical protein